MAGGFWRRIALFFYDLYQSNLISVMRIVDRFRREKPRRWRVTLMAAIDSLVIEGKINEVADAAMDRFESRHNPMPDVYSLKMEVDE